MTHELDKLDDFFNLDHGTSYDTIIRHRNPHMLNQKLVAFGIVLDKFGMVDKHQRQKWQELMQMVGISNKYWKNRDELIEEQTIDDL